MAGFFLTLLVVMGIHFLLQFFLLNIIGLPSLYVMLIIDLVLSFFFAIINYPAGYRKEAYKNPKFHMTIAIFFSIFVIFDLLFALF